MAVRFKLLLQIVMILLALDVSSPEAICSGPSSQPTTIGCCSSGMACNCHHDANGSQSCKLSSRSFLGDKSVPAKTGTAPASRLGAPLFTLVPTAPRNQVSPAAFRRDEPNVSPPFGGDSPQAVLGLWLI